MTAKPLIIGFDQTHAGDTGVCVIEYNPAGGGTPLYTDTVKGIKEIHQVIQYMSVSYKDRPPVAIAIEDAFFSPETPAAAESGWVSRGWIEAFCELYFPGVLIHVMPASEWRQVIFGANGKLDREQWKEHVWTWADARHPGFFTNDNETDAYGIVCACGTVLVRKGVIS